MRSCLRPCCMAVLMCLLNTANVLADSPPVAELLSQLIRIDTSNPPGNEAAIAEFLAPRFAQLGFEVEIVKTPEPGKAHLFARLKGDGSKRPVLLTAHADVVGVEAENWTREPFGGETVDGYVYGRGALDFKGGMAVFAEAVMRLAREKVPLSRDVVFLAAADEESGSFGTDWLADNRWDLMKAEFVLNEGGWIIKNANGDVRYVSISTADKISMRLRLIARGTSIHASTPMADNAIFALARALTRLEAYDPPPALIPSTRRFFRVLGETSAEPMRGHFFTLLDENNPERLAAAKVISEDILLHAIMHNTVAPVILEGGFRGNVVPNSASADINFRLVPGTDVYAFIEEIRRVIDEPGHPVEITVPSGIDRELLRDYVEERLSVPPSSEDTDLFRALERHAPDVYPGALVTSYVFQAATDAYPWRSRGVPVYGIYPYPVETTELQGMHGNDERVSIDSLASGVEMIYRVLLDVAAKR